MKKAICLGLVLIMMMSFCACGNGQETKETGVDTMLPKDKSYSVLFIGNSYTFYNDMPTAYFQPMATACGYDVKVTTITKGAYTLEKFADPGDVYGGIVANALSGSTHYDYVIIQEQSARPAVNTPAFYDGVRALVSRIREIGAQPVLYATWGRKDGSDKLTEYGMTSEEMTWKLAAAYDAIAEELDIPVAHAGIAFRQVYTQSKIELYNSDKSHPSPVGSYLAAMTLFCEIFGANPVELSLTGPVSGEEDALIRTAVYSVTVETPEIPDAFKTVSSGVTVATEPQS